MLGTRPLQDAPDRADDLIGYLRSGPRELPPGIPGGEPERRGRRPVVSALVCVAALAGLLVGCQIVKQPPKPARSVSAYGVSTAPSRTTAPPEPSRTTSPPEPSRTTAPPAHARTTARPPHTGLPPAPAHTAAVPSVPSAHPSSPVPALSATATLPALPATSGELAAQVSTRVFAAHTLNLGVDVSTPQAHTLRQTLNGDISVAPNGTLLGTAVGTAGRFNGVHVRAHLIFLLGQRLYIGPPASLMPPGKTWALITPAAPNGRASWAARESAYVMYASATSWNLLQYASGTTRPRWEGSGSSATAHMSGTARLATVLPHATPGARDAVITLAGPGTTEASWNVVLDRQLLPIKCVITADSPDVGPITATVTYSDWGTRVRVGAPRWADVATWDQLPFYLQEPSQ